MVKRLQQGGSRCFSHQLWNCRKKPEIERMLEYMAKKRGMTPDELFKSILDGTADSSDNEPVSEE
jgi:hypothetical protein